MKKCKIRKNRVEHFDVLLGLLSLNESLIAPVGCSECNSYALQLWVGIQPWNALFVPQTPRKSIQIDFSILVWLKSRADTREYNESKEIRHHDVTWRKSNSVTQQHSWKPQAYWIFGDGIPNFPRMVKSVQNLILLTKRNCQAFRWLEYRKSSTRGYCLNVTPNSQN